MNRRAALQASATPKAPCLGTADALLLDGANAVCGASRAHFPDAARDSIAAAIALTVILVLRKHWLSRALPFVVAAGAIPGLFAVLLLRADAPQARAGTAQVVARALEPLLDDDRESRGTMARLVRNDDGPFSPLFFFANPAHLLPSDPPTTSERLVSIGTGELGTGCARVQDAWVLRCGDSP